MQAMRFQTAFKLLILFLSAIIAITISVFFLPAAKESINHDTVNVVVEIIAPAIPFILGYMFGVRRDDD